MDRITLTGMEFFGYHGVLPEENKLGQRFVVDLVLELDLHQAGLNDDLNATINYAEVYQEVRELVEDAHKPMKTIEALAELIVSMLWTKYSMLEHITVTVHKPGAPVAGVFRDVSVTLER